MKFHVATATLTLASVLAIPAHAELRDPSAGSTSPSETLVLSVVLGPVIIASGVGVSVAGSVNASAAASTHLSESLSTHTEWTVVGMHNEHDTTQIDLQSSDETLRMTLAVPARDATARGIHLQDRITMKQLGTDSFQAEYQGRPLGVIADPAAHLAHSSKRR